MTRLACPEALTPRNPPRWRLGFQSTIPESGGRHEENHTQATAKEIVLNSTCGLISGSKAGVHIQCAKDAYKTVPPINPYPGATRSNSLGSNLRDAIFKGFPDE